MEDRADGWRDVSGCSSNNINIGSVRFQFPAVFQTLIRWDPWMWNSRTPRVVALVVLSALSLSDVTSGRILG
jgi:hypothetical protein